MVSLAVIAGTTLGGLAFKRFSPSGFRFLARRGLRGFRARGIQRAAVGSVAVGVGGGLATDLAVRGIQSIRIPLPRRQEVDMAPIRRPAGPPMRRDTVVTPGPVPVQFVKTWQACAAFFAIDTQGVRWVWRPRLGIWKRIRVTRNIVISGKDIRRARRLVRISKRLNKMRQQIR